MLFFFCTIIFIVAVITLGVSCGLAARSLFKISRIIGVNDYIVSFILLGVITSLPEMFIGLISTIAKVPLISVGNIIGANFANVTLVLGAVAILSDGIDLHALLSKRVFWLSCLLALLPPLLIFSGGVSRQDGLMLCTIFLAYCVVFARDANFFHRSRQHVPFSAHYGKEVYSSLHDLAIGIPLIILSSIFIVMFSTSLATYFSVDLIFVGTVFFGLITTLPELLFGMRSGILRHPSLALGNVLASVAWNSAFVLGMLSVVSPSIVNLSGRSLFLNAGFTFVAFVLLSIFSYTGSKINRAEGILLVSLYLLFFISSIVLI